jgi:hypothetical protein
MALSRNLGVNHAFGVTGVWNRLGVVQKYASAQFHRFPLTCVKLHISGSEIKIQQELK